MHQLLLFRLHLRRNTTTCTIDNRPPGTQKTIILGKKKKVAHFGQIQNIENNIEMPRGRPKNEIDFSLESSSRGWSRCRYASTRTLRISWTKRRRWLDGSRSCLSIAASGLWPIPGPPRKRWKRWNPRWSKEKTHTKPILLARMIERRRMFDQRRYFI